MLSGSRGVVPLLAERRPPKHSLLLVDVVVAVLLRRRPSNATGPGLPVDFLEGFDASIVRRRHPMVSQVVIPCHL